MIRKTDNPMATIHDRPRPQTKAEQRAEELKQLKWKRNWDELQRRNEVKCG